MKMRRAEMMIVVDRDRQTDTDRVSTRRHCTMKCLQARERLSVQNPELVSCKVTVA